MASCNPVITLECSSHSRGCNLLYHETLHSPNAEALLLHTGSLWVLRPTASPGSSTSFFNFSSVQLEQSCLQQHPSRMLRMMCLLDGISPVNLTDLAFVVCTLQDVELLLQAAHRYLTKLCFNRVCAPAADKIQEDAEDDTPTEDKAYNKVAGFLDRVANEAGPKADQAIDNAKGQARGLTGQSGLSEIGVGNLRSASRPLYGLHSDLCGVPSSWASAFCGLFQGTPHDAVHSFRRQLLEVHMIALRQAFTARGRSMHAPVCSSSVYHEALPGQHRPKGRAASH